MRREPQCQDYHEANELRSTRLRLSSEAIDTPRRKSAAEHAATHGQQNVRISLRYSRNLDVRFELTPRGVTYAKQKQALSVLRFHLTRKPDHQTSAPAAASGVRLLLVEPLPKRFRNAAFLRIYHTYV